MARLSERIDLATRALDQFELLAHRDSLSDLERDAAIQRFEYSFEAVWKAAQLFLREIEGLEVGSPKAAARSSFQAQLLDERQTRQALAMVDDRNLTVHTYNEPLAREIATRLPQHASLLRTWLDAIASRASAQPDS